MQSETQKLSIVRFAGAVAITLVALFAICWVAALLPFTTATHAYIGLFSSAAPTSGVALVEGLCWSAVFGLIAGAIGAFAYNLLGGSNRA